RFLIQTQFISAELMEDQLLLLLRSLERKIVSQQLKLVRTQITLGSYEGGDGNRPFCVDARLLSFPLVTEQGLTMDLVKMSGVQLWADGTAVPRDQPFEAVAALYVALYVLNLLSG
ncbi:GSDA3 protein, partial [Climacteris rufus]|nr:GSDA3 protein [Climacteris rufus]